MKLVLDFYNEKYRLRVNGTNLPSDPIVKELVSDESYQQLMQLLADEKSLIRTRQALLEKIRIEFNDQINNYWPEEKLKPLLETKYPEYFI